MSDNLPNGGLSADAPFNVVRSACASAGVRTKPMETAADTTIALDERLVPPLDSSQRAFRFALFFALLLHAVIFIEVGRSVPRTMGDRSGASDAIAVDLVTEADLKSLESVAMPPAGAPTPPPAAVPQPPPPEPQPQPTAEPQQQPTPEPQPQPEAAQPTPKEPPPQENVPEKAQEQAALPDFESFAKDLATTPQPEPEAKAPPAEVKPAEAKPEPAKPAAKQSPPAPAKKKAQPQQQTRLDPSPQDFQNAPPGRSAGASRPPGITRSGENDDFGRAVVRALRQTMPAPQGIFGRVTVRLILTENGDLAEVRVLDASGTSLDQSVVFATKQTYFPLPPYKATLADRTFLITYVYR